MGNYFTRLVLRLMDAADEGPDPNAVDPEESLFPPLHFNSMPERAHHLVSSYLSDSELITMMEVSSWLLQIYGSRVREVILDETKHDDVAPIPSLLDRRSGLIKATVKGPTAARYLAEAMRARRCDLLQTLVFQPYDEVVGPNTGMYYLCQSLKRGVCADLTCLRLRSLPGGDDTMAELGKALKTRMSKGYCSHLSVLEVTPATADKALTTLSPLLASGACEELSELNLWGWKLEDKAQKDLLDWLNKTKGAHLTSLAVHTITTATLQALCPSSSGEPSKLSSLCVGSVGREVLTALCEAMEKGAWPKFKGLKIVPEAGTADLWPRLLSSIGVGCPDLKALGLMGKAVGDGGSIKVVVEGLEKLRLEELDFSDGMVGDDGVKELVKALEGGLATNATLRKLGLCACRMGVEGVKALVEAMGRGACPGLQILDLRFNGGLKGEEGEEYLEEARKADGGALARLQEVKLA